MIVSLRITQSELYVHNYSDVLLYYLSMRLWILIVILIVSLVGSGFLYEQLHTVCNTPIHYRIGTIDERFGTNQTELRQSALHAEALWEIGRASCRERVYVLV